MIWKDIKGWENLYEISSNGDVRNKITGKLIIGDKNGIGYCRVCLHNKNHVPAKQRFFRHRLVAEHFIPNPENKREVNHKDTILTHNNVENLEWVSRKENELHSRIVGKKKYKPFIVQFDDGKSYFYHTAPDLSSMIGVTSRTVYNWLMGKHLGYAKYGIVKIQYFFN